MHNHRRPISGSALPYLTVLLSLASPSLAEPAERTVPGLRQPVEIVRDRWGIAHIYARNEHDLFLAQGYVVAGDRLFQLELWRRQALGTLAEIQGPRALARDVGARLLAYRGDITRELNRYHIRGAEIVAAFVAGVNARIEEAEREPDRLPLEFRILGVKPGRWTPEIVVSRHNGLSRNATQEVATARLVHALGAERARELLNLHPGRPRLEPDPALDVGLIRDDVLGPFQASRSAPRFRPEDVEPAYRSATPLPKDRTDEDDVKSASLGSNNWVISSDHSFSRSPIMANDPHRTIQLPSLRYWIHLSAPGWNVIGAGEPALPGVSVGHNERGAWGFTIFPIDQEDLYVYETEPGTPSRYRYGNAWEEMRVVRETFTVKGQADVVAELKFTRHGSVVHEDRAHRRAYAVRVVWLEEGTAPYLASLRLDQASSWPEFREASRHFLTPSENLVWADVDGHIGWQAVGMAPIRRNWDGLLPVPGDGRFEWEGFRPILDLPHQLDPPRGWIATANQDNLPRDFPFAVGFQWTEAFRFARLAEVLGVDRRFTLTDMMQLQQDELSIPARTLLPLLFRLRPDSIPARQALDRLRAWDFLLDRDSVPATLYVVWEKVLRNALWDLTVPAEARKAFPVRSLPTETMIRWLTAPDGRFGPDPTGKRNALLLKALEQAVAELERRLGPQMDRWSYGQRDMKHIQLHHPLSAAVKDDLRPLLDMAPLPRGGSAATVNNTSDADNQASGASFRIIADVGDWDRSLGTNTPGQSGDPDSPHYRDLFAPWAAGDYFPAFFSRPKVESVAESKTLLLPDTVAAP
jgi:penicillin amidase